MTLAPPRAGDLVRYAYLWAEQHHRGHEEARKDRPVLVLALAVRQESGKSEVLVLAVTHRPPRKAADAIAIPAVVKRRLGLDAADSFIVTTEANAFAWPGPDIRPIPGRRPASVVYGRIPDELLRRAARSFLANRKRQRAAMVLRTA